MITWLILAMCLGKVGITHATNLYTATVPLFSGGLELDTGTVQHDPTVLIVVFGPEEEIEQVLKPALTNLADFSPSVDLSFDFQAVAIHPIAMASENIVAMAVLKDTSFDTRFDEAMLANLEFSYESMAVPLDENDLVVLLTAEDTYFKVGNLSLSPGFSVSVDVEELRTIPEPSTFILIGIGLAGVGIFAKLRRRKSNGLNVRTLTLGLLILLGTQSTVYGQVYSQQRLIFSGGSGWRPMHVSMSGQKAAIQVANTHNSSGYNSTKPGRVYIWDNEQKTLTLAGQDTRPGQQIYWGFLDYKATNVAINKYFVAYPGVDNGREVLILRSLDNLQQKMTIDYKTTYGINRTCTSVSADNHDDSGFGVLLGTDVYYQPVSPDGRISAPVLVHRSQANNNDPRNPHLYDRGIQTAHGTMAWNFGGHHDWDATVMYWDGQSPHTLDGSRLDEMGIDRPNGVTWYGDYMIFNTGTQVRQPSGRDTTVVWNTRTDTLFPFVTSFNTWTIYGNVALASGFGNDGHYGIYKFQVDHPEPESTLVKLTHHNYGTSNMHQSQAHMGDEGLFAYLDMQDYNSSDDRKYDVYLSSIWRSDANLDGRVDDDDVAIFQAALTDYDSRADVDRDGDVDSDDEKILLEEYGAGLIVNTTGSGRGRVSSSPAGIECGTDCSEVYAPGTQVTLTATEDAGSVFDGWTGCDSVADNQCTVTMDTAKTVTAAFILKTYTITALAHAGGRISPSGEISVSHNNDRTFTIEPDERYLITDVRVDGSSVGAVNVYTFTNVSADHVIEAGFSAIGSCSSVWDAPSDSPRGLTTDGTYLYHIGSEDLTIYKIDPATGQVVDTIPHNVDHDRTTGLAWDGSKFWISTYFGEPGGQWVYPLSPDGQRIDDRRLRGWSYTWGLTVMDNILWGSTFGGRKLYQWGTSERQDPDRWFTSPGSYPQGITQYDGYLWNVDSGSDTLYQLNPENGEIVNSYDLPRNDPRGLTRLNGCFYVSDAATRTIYAFEPPSPHLGTTLTIFHKGSGFGTVYAGEHACRSDCTVPIPEPSSLILKAISEAGSHFVRWEDELGNPLSGIFYSDMDVTVIAVFDEN
ncbi:MAG: PEP-CTERM sorting domain-containing protein [bacterium]|nr:PEP-CTERM sorting domain-containing protein [bacterium]